MTKTEELQCFNERIDELISSKYILADIKIVGLLKVIASSDTLLALFKNCLTDFDYYGAKKKYFVRSSLSDDKGEFVMPSSSREFLAFVFNVLVDIDAKNIVLSDLLNKYFYEDGSCYSQYSAFIGEMIKPFKESVDALMEKVIEGKLQDPVEALTEEEERRAKEKAEKEKAEKESAELSKKAYGESLKKIREILLSDNKKVKDSKIRENNKKEILLVISMLANAIESDDKDAIEYAFVSYKFLAKCRKRLFFGRTRKVGKLIKDVLNGI